VYFPAGAPEKKRPRGYACTSAVETGAASTTGTPVAAIVSYHKSTENSRATPDAAGGPPGGKAPRPFLVRPYSAMSVKTTWA